MYLKSWQDRIGATTIKTCAYIKTRQDWPLHVRTMQLHAWLDQNKKLQILHLRAQAFTARSEEQSSGQKLSIKKK
jgi:hypothetical protein